MADREASLGGDVAPVREVTLPGGPVLRTARPADLDQIGALLTERGEADDALDHRLVVTDPDLGWDACAVVVDGTRVVATATLLDETVRVGDVVLPAGQVELVAVAPSHEHRGLARALMGWAHRRSAERGHVLQLMIGIPYFYRLFGYEYAIDIPPARSVAGDVARRLAEGDGAAVRTGAVGPGSATGSAGTAGATLRTASTADLPALVALQESAQAGFDVAVPHPDARWRALLAQSAATVQVLERDGVVVASARVRAGDGLLAAEPMAADEPAARGLLAALTARATESREDLSVVHRAGTVTGRVWDGLLDPADDAAEQYYVRVPDPALLLEALRPVLSRRMASTGLDAGRLGGALTISTFGAHYRLPVADGGLGPVEAGGPMQAPGARRGFGVAPDQLGALLLGGRGFAGLRRLRPDVYGDREVGEALFPPRTADVLSYYLPW